MKYLTLLLMVGFFVTKTFAQDDFSCIPKVDCQESGNTPVRDPADCTKFYSCVADENGDLLPPFQCSGDTHFDQTTSQCIPDSECTNECCAICKSFDCGINANQLVPCHCSAFYFCFEEELHFALCPSDQYFNRVSLECESGSCPYDVPAYCPLCSECHYRQTTSSPTTTDLDPTIVSDCGQPMCQQDFSCPASDGPYLDCTYCARTYWSCSAGQRTASCCIDGFVFNTNDVYPSCVLASNCPWP